MELLTRHVPIWIALALLAPIAGLIAPPNGAGAQAQVVVTPDRPLIDGEPMTLRGTGYPPGDSAATAQCLRQVLVDLEVFRFCDLNQFDVGTVAADGTIELDLTAHRWIEVDGESYDCAEGAGLCVVGITSGDDLLTTASASTSVDMEFDSTIANDPPLDIDLRITAHSARAVDATLTCNRPVTVSVRGLISQQRTHGKAEVRGNQRLDCDGETPMGVLLRPVPHRLETQIRPYRRLVSGPAQLEVRAVGRVGRWRDVTQSTRRASIDQPDLTRTMSQTSKGMDVELVGLRISRSGRAIAKVETRCDRPLTKVHVSVELLSPAPGAAYRAAFDSTSVGSCNGTTTHQVEIDGETRSRVRDDVISPGPVEVVVRASRFSVDTINGATTMRRAHLGRTYLPAAIRVDPSPRSRLRVGAVTTRTGRASFECARTAPFSIFTTVGQRTGPVVRTSSDATWMQCRASHTVPFTVTWPDPLAPGIPAAVNLRAVNGVVGAHQGPWQQTQGAWRTVP